MLYMWQIYLYWLGIGIACLSLIFVGRITNKALAELESVLHFNASLMKRNKYLETRVLELMEKK